MKTLTIGRGVLKDGSCAPWQAPWQAGAYGL